MGISYFSQAQTLRNRCVCIGDSHTYNGSTGLGLTDFYTFKIEAALRINRGNVQFANLGVSGNTTGQMLTRAQALSAPPYAVACVIYGGTNDGSGGDANTQSNIVSIGQTLAALGYTRQIVGLQHYLNFSTGGDTVATPVESNVTLRTKQAAAAAELGATVADFYTYMRGLIVAGTHQQGSASWHVADGNTHLNAIGQSILASCIMSVIPVSWRGALMS